MRERQRLRVLLTEDEALIGMDLCELLSEAGYDVVGPATTVAESVALLIREDPDLAIIDIVLKDGSCVDLARELRRRAVPFLVHSGPQRRPETGGAFGAAPWLAKPVAPEDILETLSDLAASR